MYWIRSRAAICFALIRPKAFPDAAKLEMYCRSPRPGWTVFGNETETPAPLPQDEALPLVFMLG